LDPKGFGAVDGSEIRSNHLGCIPNPANHGINYQPQLLFSPDFWLPSTVPSTHQGKRQDLARELPKLQCLGCLGRKDGGWWPEKTIGAIP